MPQSISCVGRSHFTGSLRSSLVIAISDLVVFLRFELQDHGVLDEFELPAFTSAEWSEGQLSWFETMHKMHAIARATPALWPTIIAVGQTVTFDVSVT